MFWNAMRHELCEQSVSNTDKSEIATHQNVTNEFKATESVGSLSIS
jgi:hypothetical protein